MSRPLTLALDAMSGDHGCDVVVPAAVRALREHPGLEVILVGDEQALLPLLRDCSERSRIRVQHASEVVTMDDKPSKALRNKKDSSMRVAVNLVKQGEADACVSAGNTGALMATARFVLKTLPGIDRPAIISEMPSVNRHTYMLDLGANAECTAEQLFQFAVMGSVLVTSMHGEQKPRVGLLNIGEEEIKGSEAIQTVSRMLAASELNYIGFVEGDDTYLGDVDVVVCDGFAGNIALKSSEGVAKLIARYMREEFTRNWWTKLIALLSMPVLKAFKNRIDPGNYNGASFLGLNGIVIKSHGSADEKSFANAIGIAVAEVEKNISARICDLVASALDRGEQADKL
ncbi:MAG: phosphate acyltransferase PlsX [Nevskiales bacterium]